MLLARVGQFLGRRAGQQRSHGSAHQLRARSRDHHPSPPSSRSPAQRQDSRRHAVRPSTLYLETDRNPVSVTVFRPKLGHVETETSRNWISSEQTVVGNGLPANSYLVQQDKSTRTDEAI